MFVSVRTHNYTLVCVRACVHSCAHTCTVIIFLDFFCLYFFQRKPDQQTQPSPLQVRQTLFSVRPWQEMPELAVWMRVSGSNPPCGQSSVEKICHFNRHKGINARLRTHFVFFDLWAVYVGPCITSWLTKMQSWESGRGREGASTSLLSNVTYG